MTTQNRGDAPAFPRTYSESVVSRGTMTRGMSPNDGTVGMTIREYYAAQAMVGLLPSLARDLPAVVRNEPEFDSAMKSIARLAWLMADTMLAEQP